MLQLSDLGFQHHEFPRELPKRDNVDGREDFPYSFPSRPALTYPLSRPVLVGSGDSSSSSSSPYPYYSFLYRRPIKVPEHFRVDTEPRLLVPPDYIMLIILYIYPGHFASYRLLTTIPPNKPLTEQCIRLPKSLPLPSHITTG